MVEVVPSSTNRVAKLHNAAIAAGRRSAQAESEVNKVNWRRLLFLPPILIAIAVVYVMTRPDGPTGSEIGRAHV